MKIAVINFSGNVGETTISRHLLLPRIPGAELIAIESINADEGHQGQSLRGRQFGELQEYMQTVDSLVVDIGASNVEDLLALMRKYRGSHEDFDYFVVPTVPALKQQQDTIATLTELARLGIPATRLRVVNQVEDDRPIEQVFETPTVRSPASQARTATCMRQNEVTDSWHRPPVELVGLDRLQGEDCEGDFVRQAAGTKLATQRLARGVVPELDACFQALDLQSSLRADEAGRRQHEPSSHGARH
jgi:hypothetical protein